MMKYILSIVVSILCISYGYAQNHNLVDYVNTLQGSHNTPDFSYGRCTPNVGLPNAVNLWSPTSFNYVAKTVKGLGGGGFSLIPYIGKPDINDKSLSYTFNPDKVVGKPHYFKLTTDNSITMEMSPTERCAYFQFSYPRSKEANLIIAGPDETNVIVAPDQRKVTGYIVGRSNHQQQIEQRTYFILEFDQPFVSYGTIGESGKGSTYIEFKKGAKVQIKASVSRISQKQAEITFNREIASYNFNEIRDKAAKVWNELFNKIQIEGGTLEQRKTFYSCFFWAALRPGRNYELDENENPHFSYNGIVHKGYYHSNPILWDAYRSLFALHNIINTEEQKVYVQSLMKTKPLTGWWPSGHVMIGNHTISVLADAWAKGIRTFDPETALNYYYNEVTKSVLDTINNTAYNKDHLRGYGRMGFEDYFAAGYIPYPQNTDRVMETTSKTIEYNYDDFCAYKLAKMIGNKFYENIFAKHIYNYKNVFDPSDQFFKGRDVEGNFDDDFNPYEWGGPFVEGNGWQWRFSVQQDAQGMIDLMGGEKQFLSNLDELFTVCSDSVLHGGYGYRIHEINEAVAGGQGQYAQGNEPCFHVIHLYNYAGQPWKAQKTLRESMTKLYNSGPKGFPGDEDGGAMSSWYVFNAMGFYPVTPGVSQYTLGSPLFNKITISLESGKKFTIIANNNNLDNVYIKSATLNGKPYSKSWLSHKTLMNGGELILEMSEQPNMQRGTQEEDRPYSLSKHN